MTSAWPPQPARHSVKKICLTPTRSERTPSGRRADLGMTSSALRLWPAASCVPGRPLDRRAHSVARLAAASDLPGFVLNRWAILEIRLPPAPCVAPVKLFAGRCGARLSGLLVRVALNTMRTGHADRAPPALCAPRHCGLPTLTMGVKAESIAAGYRGDISGMS